jgi:hypothetical protein
MHDNTDDDKQNKVVTESARVRPSNELVAFHLRETAPLENLGVAWSDKVSSGTVDLYNRLKPRDAVDSIYCMSIVAMANASMKFYSVATRRMESESLDRAYEGTARLMELVTARENRRALLGDPNRREEILEELVKRYGLPSTPSGK